MLCVRDKITDTADEKSAEKKTSIEMLKKQLDEARKHRAQVSEYNIIANKILAYPSREEMMEYVMCINKSALYNSIVTASRNYRTKSRNMMMQVLLPRMN